MVYKVNIGFITHLGKNTSHGHYVSHVRKNGQWIYYNDSKVTVSQEPPFQKGYIYIFANNQ
jgi:ubiquitin carboxyl-terminal hydrolase 5/13